jgi:hypothetical protein
MQQQIPMTRNAEGEQVLVTNGASSPTLADVLTLVNTGLQKAAANMDDMSLEMDMTGERLLVKFRAYRRK